jgi:hypothetical protein
LIVRATLSPIVTTGLTRWSMLKRGNKNGTAEQAGALHGLPDQVRQ